jgi:hypothetical protein
LRVEPLGDEWNKYWEKENAADDCQQIYKILYGEEDSLPTKFGQE